MAPPYAPTAKQAVVLLGMLFVTAACAALLSGLGGIPAAALLVTICAAELAAVWALLGWRLAVTALLVVGALVTRYTIAIGTLNLRVEEVALVLSVLVVAWQLVARRSRPVWGRADLLLAAWVMANAVGSLAAPSPAGSLKLTAQIALFFLGYLLVQQLAQRREQLYFAHAALAWTITLVAAFGVVAYAILPLGPNIGVQVNPDTGLPSAYATLFEGNIFGSTVMVGWCWWLVLLPERGPVRRLAIAGFAVCSVAIVVSLTRGAWVAVAAILGLLALGYAWRRVGKSRVVSGWRWSRGRAIALGVALTCVVLLAGYMLLARTGEAAPPRPPTPAGERIPDLQGPDTADPLSAIFKRIFTFSQLPGDGTARMRVRMAGLTLADLGHHPVFGSGPGSYLQRHELWLSVLPLRILNDTGLVGMLIFIAFVVLLARDFVRVYGHTTALLRKMLLAQALALVGLFIAYLFTEGLQLFFPWLLLGLFAATLRVAGNKSGEVPML